MKLVGLMPVRNEDWCLGLTARAALMWVDQLVMLDHASTDASSDIIAEIGRESGRVVHLVDANPRWDEMRHRQSMLDVARHLEATHIAIIDADEILTGNLLTSCGDGFCCIQGVVETSERGILQFPGYNLRNGINRYHNNGIWGNRWFSTAFRDDPRLSWNGDNFHHREPKGIELKPYRPIAQGQGGIMHLWGASERRLKAKSALYKITERIRWPDKRVSDIDTMYSWAIKGAKDSCYGTPDTWTYAEVPEEWLAPYAHLMKYLHIDAEPWQEAECRRLMAEHGRERFAGLDLFDVV